MTPETARHPEAAWAARRGRRVVAGAVGCRRTGSAKRTEDLCEEGRHGETYFTDRSTERGRVSL